MWTFNHCNSIIPELRTLFRITTQSVKRQILHQWRGLIAIVLLIDFITPAASAAAVASCLIIALSYDLCFDQICIYKLPLVRFTVSSLKCRRVVLISCFKLPDVVIIWLHLFLLFLLAVLITCAFQCLYVRSCVFVYVCMYVRACRLSGSV